jgi:hypothetical protein
LLWAGLSIFALLSLWREGLLQGELIYLALHIALLWWWNNLTPFNQHLWEDDVAQMTSGHVDGTHLLQSHGLSSRLLAEVRAVSAAANGPPA